MEVKLERVEKRVMDCVQPVIIALKHLHHQLLTYVVVRSFTVPKAHLLLDTWTLVSTPTNQSQASRVVLSHLALQGHTVHQTA